MIVYGIAVSKPIVFTLLVSTCVLWRVCLATSHPPPARKQPLRSVELSQASGGVGAPALGEPQPREECLWCAGNAASYFLGEKKKKEVLHFPWLSSAGSPRKLPTADCQLQGTLPTGKLSSVLYG